MKDFEPADDFVTRVMSGVHAYEKMKDPEKTKAVLRLSKPVFYALSAGGILLWILNFLRIAFAFISPALCR